MSRTEIKKVVLMLLASDFRSLPTLKNYQVGAVVQATAICLMHERNATEWTVRFIASEFLRKYA
jgi:hypothetical protein